MIRRRPRRAVSVRRALVGPLGLVVMALAACSAEVVPSSGAADCDRIAELAAEGRPVETVESALKPAQAIEIPRPDGVDDVVATVVARGDAPQIGPDESTIGLPDRDVDTVVAVARADADLEDLERRVDAAAQSQGMESAGGSRAEANGKLVRFTGSYSGSGVDLTVASYSCDGDTWLVFGMPVVPPTPESAATPLPSCAELTTRFPAGVYAEPTYFPDPDIPDEVDDAEGSERRCRIRQADTGSFETRTQVYLRRPAPDPESWRSRLHQLRSGPEDFVAHTCAVDGEPEPLPDGHPDAVSCVGVDALEAEASVAAVIDNDYWIGVRHTVRLPNEQDESTQNADQAVVTATQVFEAMQP